MLGTGLGIPPAAHAACEPGPAQLRDTIAALFADGGSACDANGDGVVSAADLVAVQLADLADADGHGKCDRRGCNGDRQLGGERDRDAVGNRHRRRDGHAVHDRDRVANRWLDPDGNRQPGPDAVSHRIGNGIGYRVPRHRDGDRPLGDEHADRDALGGPQRARRRRRR